MIGLLTKTELTGCVNLMVTFCGGMAQNGSSIAVNQISNNQILTQHEGSRIQGGPLFTCIFVSTIVYSHREQDSIL